MEESKANLTTLSPSGSNAIPSAVISLEDLTFKILFTPSIVSLLSAKAYNQSLPMAQGFHISNFAKFWIGNKNTNLHIASPGLPIHNYYGNTSTLQNPYNTPSRKKYSSITSYLRKTKCIFKCD